MGSIIQSEVTKAQKRHIQKLIKIFIFSVKSILFKSFYDSQEFQVCYTLGLRKFTSEHETHFIVFLNKI
jgi:hypothetical protein